MDKSFFFMVGLDILMDDRCRRPTKIGFRLSDPKCCGGSRGSPTSDVWCFAGVQGRDGRRGARRVRAARPSSMAFLFENMVNLMASAART